MKKVLVSMAVVALLATSCKGEKKEINDVVKNTTTEMKKEVETKVEESTKEVSNSIESAIAGVTIPKFENVEVTKHLQSYATYANEYIAAKGDVLKNAKLAKEGVALAKKGKELLGTLDAESSKKFKSVMNAIQSKMAPAK